MDRDGHSSYIVGGCQYGWVWVCLIVDYVVAEFVRWVLYTICYPAIPLLVCTVPAGLPAVDGRDVVVGARHGAPSQLRGPDITGARRRYVLTCCKKRKLA